MKEDNILQWKERLEEMVADTPALQADVEVASLADHDADAESGGPGGPASPADDEEVSLESVDVELSRVEGLSLSASGDVASLEDDTNPKKVTGRKEGTNPGDVTASRDGDAPKGGTDPVAAPVADPGAPQVSPLAPFEDTPAELSGSAVTRPPAVRAPAAVADAATNLSAVQLANKVAEAVNSSEDEIFKSVKDKVTVLESDGGAATLNVNGEQKVRLSDGDGAVTLKAVEPKASEDAVLLFAKAIIDSGCNTPTFKKGRITDIVSVLKKVKEIDPEFALNPELSTSLQSKLDANSALKQEYQRLTTKPDDGNGVEVELGSGGPAGP